VYLSSLKRFREPAGELTMGIMKIALIALALLATTGVVYAACVFC
jgi:hypothetical protein